MFGEYTPLMKTGLMEQRVARGKAVIDPELGLQKWCPDCQEFWPQDTLFWSISNYKPDGLQGTCKACQLGKKREKRNAA
ncbi:hypothetical protein A8139_21495 [Marinomonas primoryensis]|uniref:Uncharacterized protein n=1 Tax=Marinomonas primoryensis TaxID=178399 RepID=A0A2Z4PMK5_9GAMM|nr:hypothetical protein [Marinomonas primoryensis]AWX98699.1 hypothetical protein A8139_00840 [Marinomonas primoryensis]AWY02224.1 hypothetical protein A8139_21495 [Marinomonas primoryensis]